MVRCRAVRFAAFFEDRTGVDPNRLLFESLVVADCTRRPPRDDLPAYYGHEAGFIRIALHLCHRAERAGVSIAPAASAGVATAMRPEDLELICFEYVTG